MLTILEGDQASHDPKPPLTKPQGDAIACAHHRNISLTSPDNNMPESSHTASNNQTQIRQSPSDYDAIREENRRRYGTDIERIGPMLLANRYADRTQFIYELLQNAEDALNRRTDSHNHRMVSFDLDADRLRVSHYGVPFNEEDVRGVCGIGESTKKLNEIGRFGIGFKSVFAFTERPEIHSGAESFAVESYVWPVATAPERRERDETVFVIPFRDRGDASKGEVADALSRLGTFSLLFLKDIEEIRWHVDGNPIGHYLREFADEGPNVRRVTIIGEKHAQSNVDHEWLVFSRPVHTEGGTLAGHVEVAWYTETDEHGHSTIRPVNDSCLVVFFPTAIETHLGILIQGPYRTTPSRDNVPERDEWNQKCLEETGVLLIDSLRWLRDHGLLDATTLTCLPIDPDTFEDSRFSPLLEATRNALTTEELLPTSSGQHVSGSNSRLARTEDLRGLLSPDQLGALEGHTRPLHWLDGEISQSTNPGLRDFLVSNLGIQELTPNAFVRRLTTTFLEQQTHEWIEHLYEFLSTQQALRSRVRSTPIIRLTDNSHVQPWEGDEPQAFLPGPRETHFPTVHIEVCQTEEARDFLESLGLTEPDPVDDVIQNVVGKFRDDQVEYSEFEYSADVDLILKAARTDSRSQRDKLDNALSDARWVRAVDGIGETGFWKKPGDLYLATERLHHLFRDVPEVYFVDDAIACLKAKEIRGLLERTGASRTLKSTEMDCDLSRKELSAIRRNAGLERETCSKVEDLTIRGLDALLGKLPTLEPTEQRKRSEHLWDALDELEARGRGPFEAVYTWRFGAMRKTAMFDSALVRTLNQYPWVPDSSGALQPPGSVVFEQTGWDRSDFLESKIRFRPSAMSLLEREAGLEPGVLDLVKEAGLTKAELQALLGLDEDRKKPKITRDDHAAPSIAEEMRPEISERDSMNADETEAGPDTDNVQTPKPIYEIVRPRQFISYVGVVQKNEDDANTDGLDNSDRMGLERSAIEFILDHEPDWQRTATNNPGFDLFRGPAIETATHWCEVKAMAGTLDDRPVGMSSTQFEYAQSRGSAFWLYVVERAGTETPNLLRIQDPVGKAKTFTFDVGWRSAADDPD
ncbi:MAG: DUF3883 domain-containing protein [Acidimicrobiaceae bacterium]|nr:DUF3883 domain-containing protein [Acidimicrobiaceae bacterium]